MAPPEEVSATGDAPFRTGTKTGKKKSNGIKKKNAPPSPRKSLVRKRPVSFGNPALGTYHGCIYTLDFVGQDYSKIKMPVIEGATYVERVVAMVDVPPDQVPEGILNLARSHQPYLYHVRIVIAENKEEYKLVPDPKETTKFKSLQVHLGQAETKDEMASSLIGLEEFGSPSRSASTMADDEDYPLISNNETSSKEGTNNVTVKDNTDPNLIDDSKQDGIFCASSRTYVVLLELCSVEAAEGFVEDLHGKPYTSLDPSRKCSVYQVLALTGEDGVSLLSPFFAPTAKGTSPKNGTNVPVDASLSTSTQTTSLKAPAAPIVEDYNCAVCLEHMILSEAEYDNNNGSKMRSSILTSLCNHSFHMDCLLKWQDSPCPVCRYDHSGLNEALSQCHVCGTTENNYVCLICGVISCGGPPIRRQNGAISNADETNCTQSQSPICGSRAATVSYNAGGCGPTGAATTARHPEENSWNLSPSHARRHYDETLHAYALDTETQHVYDYAGQGYVHRLLQNMEDGKLVEFHDPSNTSSHERSLTPGLSDVQEGEVLHRKLEGFASQYYTLLKSQLEQQRIYYQGRLQELRRESIVRKKAQTSDFINALKQERAQLSRRVVSLKARRCKVVEDTSFLRNMNESLEANKDPLKRKVKEAQQQRIAARDQLQQRLPALEEKITVLLQELTGEATVENSGGNNTGDKHLDAGENPKRLLHGKNSDGDRMNAEKG